MDCGLFGVRFLFLGFKNGAAAPVDYSFTFATPPDLWSEKLYDSEKIKAEIFRFEKYLSKCNRTKPAPNRPIFHPKTITNTCFTRHSNMDHTHHTKK